MGYEMGISLISDWMEGCYYPPFHLFPIDTCYFRISILRVAVKSPAVSV